MERKTLERMSLAKGLNGGERPLDKAFEIEHWGREIATGSDSIGTLIATILWPKYLWCQVPVISLYP